MKIDHWRIGLAAIVGAMVGPASWVCAVTLADVKDLEINPQRAAQSALQAIDWGPVLPSLHITPAVCGLPPAAWMTASRSPSDSPLALQMSFDDEGNIIAQPTISHQGTRLLTPEQVLRLTGTLPEDSHFTDWGTGLIDDPAMVHQFWLDIRAGNPSNQDSLWFPTLGSVNPVAAR